MPVQPQQAFDSSYGVIHMPGVRGDPTAAAVPASGMPPVDINSVVGAMGGAPNVIGTSAPVIDPTTGQPVPPEQIAAAQQAAASGDQNAVAWLTGLGLLGAAAGGAYALSKVKKKVPASGTGTFGAGDIQDAEFKDVRKGLSGPKPQAKLKGAAQQRIGQTRAITDQSKPKALTDARRKVPGPTKQQTEQDIAYAQKKIQDTKVAKRGAPSALKRARLDRFARAAAKRVR